MLGGYSRVTVSFAAAIKKDLMVRSPSASERASNHADDVGQQRL
jgi:hypothetical protein